MRKICVNRPVLKEVGPVMINFPESSLIDHFLGQGNCWNSTGGVPNHIGHSRFLHFADHGFAFLAIQSQRLFAEDGLARLGCGNGDVVVHVVGRRDIDDVDVVPCDEFFPIRFHGFVSPLIRKFFSPILVAGADCRQLRFVLQFGEEVRNLTEGVGMGTAHEAVTD